LPSPYDPWSRARRRPVDRAQTEQESYSPPNVAPAPGVQDSKHGDTGAGPDGRAEWDRLLVLRLDEQGNAIPVDRLVLQREGRPDEIVALPAVGSRRLETPPERFVIRLR
jgi:hypothetical protein